MSSTPWTNRLAVLAAVLVLGAPARLFAGSEPVTAEVMGALERSIEWLARHPPDPRHDKLGNLGLDAVTWYLFAALHPDELVRERAGGELDRRLRGLPAPGEQDLVSLSYWAVLLRIAGIRGHRAAEHRAALEKADIEAVVSAANPTTGWWTAELLRRSGLPVEADFSRTFIARQTAAGLTYRDAYRLFHELIPATDLGREPPSLTGGQEAFVRRVLPDLIRASRAAGDTDALAEALVSAALMDERETAAYRAGLAELLAHQRPDGAYVSARQRAAAGPGDFRHGVQVASWALLTSLGAPED